MEPLYSIAINTAFGKKELAVYHADVTEFDEKIDVLTVSAFHNAYNPTKRTMILALKEKWGISVKDLAKEPEVDLRELCHIWLSIPVHKENCPIGRIGCVEMLSYLASMFSEHYDKEKASLNSIKAYFQMLDLTATGGICMDTVAIPFLGTGSQQVEQEMIKIPLVNECISSLKRNPAIKRIIFVEKSPKKAYILARALEESYAIKSEAILNEQNENLKKSSCTKGQAFISYSSKDKEATEQLCKVLENAGVKVWYAPRDIGRADYASEIVTAIMNASCFIVLLSKNSLNSQHVLNEIDVAFKRMKEDRKLLPIRLEEVEMIPAFEYYLSRFTWTDAFTNGDKNDFSKILGKIL